MDKCCGQYKHVEDLMALELWEKIGEKIITGELETLKKIT